MNASETERWVGNEQYGLDDEGRCSGCGMVHNGDCPRCGCKSAPYSSSVTWFCDLHAAASALLDALEAFTEAENDLGPAKDSEPRMDVARRAAYAAMAMARGEAAPQW